MNERSKSGGGGGTDANAFCRENMTVNVKALGNLNRVLFWAEWLGRHKSVVAVVFCITRTTRITGAHETEDRNASRISSFPYVQLL